MGDTAVLQHALCQYFGDTSKSYSEWLSVSKILVMSWLSNAANLSETHSESALEPFCKPHGLYNEPSALAVLA